MTTVRVSHCHDSYSAILTTPGDKIVYSGDCRPSLDLIAAGRDATGLIHEATFAGRPEMVDKDSREAAARRHCTAREAVVVGERMRAQVVLLNHFSARYRVACSGDAFVREGPGEVGLALDGMRVALGGAGHARFGQGYWKALDALVGPPRVSPESVDRAEKKERRVKRKREE